MYRNVTIIITIIILNVYLSATMNAFSIDNRQPHLVNLNADSINKKRTNTAKRESGSENLYSEFNNRLDEISNYAKSRFDSELSPSINTIYDFNGKRLLDLELQQQQKREQRHQQIEKANKAEKFDGYGDDRRSNSELKNLQKSLVRLADNDAEPSTGLESERYFLSYLNPSNDIRSDSHKMCKRIPLQKSCRCQSKSFSTTPDMQSSFSVQNDGKQSKAIRRRTARHKSSRTQPRELLWSPVRFKKSSKESDSLLPEWRSADLGKIPSDQMIYDKTVGDKDENNHNIHHGHLFEEFSPSLEYDTRNVEDNEENENNNWKLSSPTFAANLNQKDEGARNVAPLVGKNPQTDQSIKDTFTREFVPSSLGTDSSAYPNVLTNGINKNPSLVPSFDNLPPVVSISGAPVSIPSTADLISKFGAVDQKAVDMYLKNSVNPLPENERIVKQTAPEVAPTACSDNVTNVLEGVLFELESLKQCKMSKAGHPEGAPCNILGTWNSQVIGLRFHLSKSASTESEPSLVRKRRTRHAAPVEPTKLSVEAENTIPPRNHELMDFSWRTSGNAQRQFGGPIVILAQKPEENSLATFTGFCRTCGGVDTIFGSWTFVHPSKDCHDMAVSIENRRDVLRRSSMEARKKELMQKYLIKAKNRP